MKHAVTALAVLMFAVPAAAQPAASTTSDSEKPAIDSFREGVQLLEKAQQNFIQARKQAQASGTDLPEQAETVINQSLELSVPELPEEVSEEERDSEKETEESEASEEEADSRETESRPDFAGRGRDDSESQRRGPPEFVSERVPSIVREVTPSFVFG